MTPERIANMRATNGVTVTCDDGTQRTFGHDPIRAELLDEIERLQPLATFGQWVLDQTTESISEGVGALDIADIADEAVNCGLIQWVAYDPEEHDNISGDFDGRPGDMIYYWGPKQ